MMNYLDYFDNQSIENIIQACKDDYDWRYVNGELPKDSIIHKMATDMQTYETEVVEELEYYAAMKLENVIKLLVARQMWRFIKI